MPLEQSVGGSVIIMVVPRHLSKAPIVEAIIHLRVKLPPDIDHTKLLSLHDMIKDQYPNHKTHRVGTFKIELPDGELAKSAVEDEGIVGYRFTSKDEKKIVQFNLNDFVFSQLYPYENWEKARDEAKRLWTIFADAVSPETIKRVALRYINRLEVPQDLKDFNEYLTMPPNVPAALPQALSSFLTRMVIPDDSLKATAIITQALETSANPKTVPIILDIDVFREYDYDPKGSEVWDYLEQLRVLKNKIFFESITEKIAEMYT